MMKDFSSLDFWTAQSYPPGWIWIVGVLISFGLFASLYPLIKGFSVLVHECCHAVVGSMVGRKVHAVAVHADGSGSTISSGMPTGLGVWLTTFAGYPGPIILGVLMLVGQGFPRIITAFMMLILFFLLLKSRSLLAVVTMIVSLAIFSFLLVSSVMINSVALLIIGGVFAGMGMWETWHSVAINKHIETYGDDGQGVSDQKALSQLGFGSVMFWCWFMVVFAAVALVGGALFAVGILGLT